MADFNVVLAELQKHLAAVTDVLGKHPNIASEVKKAKAALPDPQADADAQAQVNALMRTAEAAGLVPDVAPDTGLTDEIAKNIQ